MIKKQCTGHGPGITGANRRCGPDVVEMLCDGRDEISRARAQALNRMHRLFLELLPGGAPVKKSTEQYKVLLARVRPRDPAGKMRRRMAAEELAELSADHRSTAPKAVLRAQRSCGVSAGAPGSAGG